MKNLWKNYTYVIILVVLCMVSLLIIKINLPTTSENYMTITVSAGDSLWEISKKYEKQHGLSEKEFIKWVEQYNGISGDHIFIGDRLIIPIDSSNLEIMEVHDLASN